VREHRALKEDVLTNRVACASPGCHGSSHPFNKVPQAEEQATR
jgi:hypothetical protein